MNTGLEVKNSLMCAIQLKTFIKLFLNKDAALLTLHNIAFLFRSLKQSSSTFKTVRHEEYNQTIYILITLLILFYKTRSSIVSHISMRLAH